MSDKWLICPYCSLAFGSEADYRRHHELNHPNRKFMPATKFRAKRRWGEKNVCILFLKKNKKSCKKGIPLLRWSIKGHSPPSNSTFSSLNHAVSFKVIQNMFLCFFKFRPPKLIRAVWFSSPYSTSFRIMSLMMYYIFEIPIRARWARHAYFCRLGLPLHSHITSVLSSLTWLSHSLITETASLPLHVAMALSRIMPHI